MTQGETERHIGRCRDLETDRGETEGHTKGRERARVSQGVVLVTEGDREIGRRTVCGWKVVGAAELHGAPNEDRHSVSQSNVSWVYPVPE